MTHTALHSAIQTAIGTVLGVAMAAAVAFAPARALGQDAPAAAAPATTASAQATRTIVPARGSGPTLWVVRDADSTLYLFGTVHMLRPDTPWGTERVQAAFASADELWLEVANVDDQAAVLPLIQRYGLSPERTLSSRLTETELTQLAEAATAMGMPPAALDRMQPWLAGLTLAMAPLSRAGYQPDSGVEMILKSWAQSQGKPVRGLETLEQQIGFLATQSEATQLASLRTVLEDYETATTQLDQMVAAWARGDQRTLQRLSVDEMKAQSIYLYDAMLVRRNADWAGQIDDMLDGSGTAFIAVGAAHLTGDDSVIEMLGERGINVQRVP